MDKFGIGKRIHQKISVSIDTLYPHCKCSILQIETVLVNKPLNRWNKKANARLCYRERGRHRKRLKQKTRG